jgi:glycine oxidase
MAETVAVVGGGVIGLSIAWQAARRGLTVTVADPAPGLGAAQAAVGILTQVSEPEYAGQDGVRLSQASLARYPSFAADLAAATGEQAGFRQSGTLHVGYDAGDIAAIDGVAVQRLTGQECLALEPALDPAVKCGLLVEGDSRVDPRLLTRALLAAVDGVGVKVVRQPVTEILRAPGDERAVGVLLPDGTRLLADWVVLAGGWESASVRGLPSSGVPPLRPVKGQIVLLRTGPMAAPFVSRTVRGIIRGSSVWLVPTADGRLVVGSTQEDRGPDTRVTAGGIAGLLRDAGALAPGASDLEFSTALAGLRPCTPDGAPILGPAGLAGLVLATGHFRNGVLLAPITAEITTEYLTTGQLPVIAEPFSGTRFRARQGDQSAS